MFLHFTETQKAGKKSLWRSAAKKIEVDTDLVVELLDEIKPIAKVKPEAIKTIKEMIKFATPASLSLEVSFENAIGTWKIL